MLSTFFNFLKLYRRDHLHRTSDFLNIFCRGNLYFQLFNICHRYKNKDYTSKEKKLKLFCCNRNDIIFNKSKPSLNVYLFRLFHKFLKRSKLSWLRQIGNLSGTKQSHQIDMSRQNSYYSLRSWETNLPYTPWIQLTLNTHNTKQHHNQQVN